MQWLKKERCKACSDERSVRYCLRRNKELGWKCCNGYRADGKCPEACPYTPKTDTASSLLPQIKSDSRTEFLDYLERYLHFWIYVSRSDLDNKSPYDLSQTSDGKTRLKDWLSGFSFLDSGIITLLNKKLNLELPIPEETNPNTEILTAGYLDAVIGQDWDAVAGFHINLSACPQDTITLFIRQLRTHPALRKVRSWSIVNSGFTQDLKQAFVYCELNSKENWTFIFVNSDSGWHIYQTIWGTLQDYYDQKNQFREIAVAISQKNEIALFARLESIKDSFPLSADIQYYYGLCYNLSNRIADAGTAFQNAIALEPNWQEPIFQLAFLHMNQKEYTIALTHWEQLAKLNPQDVNVQNNIGVCLLGLGQADQAKSVWTAALQIDPDSEVLTKNLEHLQHG
jgi:tetratricopeptide (TPR) repeat protein